MKILLSLLKDFIDTGLNRDQMAKALTMAGLEVDAVHDQSLGVSQVVVCKVLQVEKHPQADKLSLATVTDGEKTVQVVCAATNCREGIKTALAVVGATVLDDAGKPFKIKKSKIRGIESCGMLCAPVEIGLPGDSGIIEFSDHIKEGTDVASMYTDTIFDISITPNLGHCMSVLGVARELSAATNRPVHLPSVQLNESAALSINDQIRVEVSDQKACPKYACRMLKNCKTGPSPDWLQTRLEILGPRSINNVVDVTNYVMMELGHPLHAFDAKKISGTLRIRNGQKGEKFLALDGKEHQLDETDLVIADDAKVLALAGIIGGSCSEVDGTTENILLEAAYFNPVTVRRTAKKLGISTDASKHFERGCDPNILTFSLDRAAKLIQQVAGGEICSGTLEIGPKSFPAKKIACRVARVNRVLGTSLNGNELATIFQRLGFTSVFDGADLLRVDVPAYRNDINEEIDLVSEAARIYGYQNINQATFSSHSCPIPHAPFYLFEAEMRTRLLKEGLQEFLTCDLIGPALLGLTEENGHDVTEERSRIHVLNPTSIEQSILRTSLLHGLLGVVKYNYDRQIHNIAGFEIGRIHFKEKESYIEQPVASIVLSGKSRPDHWDRKPLEVDFFDLKGIVENIVNECKLQDVAFRPSSLPLFHPGRQAAIYIGPKLIGMMGEVHINVIRRLDIPQRILVAEINLHELHALVVRNTAFEEIPPYPSSERDWTVSLDNDTPIDELFQAIRKNATPLLEKSSLIDLYRSETLGSNIKNATFRFTYRDKEKTLNQELVDTTHQRLVAQLMQSIPKHKGN